jgi:hypothetical protein
MAHYIQLLFVSVASTTFHYHILAPKKETFLTLCSMGVAYTSLLSLFVTTEYTALFIVSHSTMFGAKPTIHNYIVATRKVTFPLLGTMAYTHTAYPCHFFTARRYAPFPFFFLKG